jgi:hypothetical protein
MNFSDALSLLKAGQKVCRFGWNGKGMWLKIVDYWISAAYVDCECAEQDNNLPFIVMKTADNHFVPWLASQTDILAVDWMVVG